MKCSISSFLFFEERASVNKRYRREAMAVEVDKQDASAVDFDFSKIVETKEFKGLVETAVTEYLSNLPMKNFCHLFKECKGELSRITPQ